MEAEDKNKDIKLEQAETETAKKKNLKKESNLKKAEIDSSKKKNLKKEIGGQDGPEPTRFGDWEKKGITSDF